MLVIISFLKLDIILILFFSIYFSEYSHKIDNVKDIIQYLGDKYPNKIYIIRCAKQKMRKTNNLLNYLKNIQYVFSRLIIFLCYPRFFIFCICIFYFISWFRGWFRTRRCLRFWFRFCFSLWFCYRFFFCKYCI